MSFCRSSARPAAAEVVACGPEPTSLVFAAIADFWFVLLVVGLQDGFIKKPISLANVLWQIRGDATNLLAHRLKNASY